MIVVALFLVALVAAMSYTMMARLARDTRRSELIMHDVQAELYAEGSVLWAKDSLRENWIRQKKDKRVDATHGDRVILENNEELLFQGIIS